MLLAARTSGAVAKAGSERAWVSLREEEGAGDGFVGAVLTTMAWVMAAMWVVVEGGGEARCRDGREVPKETRWAGMAASGWSP